MFFDDLNGQVFIRVLQTAKHVGPSRARAIYREAGEPDSVSALYERVASLPDQKPDGVPQVAVRSAERMLQDLVNPKRSGYGSEAFLVAVLKAWADMFFSEVNIQLSATGDTEDVRPFAAGMSALEDPGSVLRIVCMLMHRSEHLPDPPEEVVLDSRESFWDQFPVGPPRRLNNDSSEGNNEGEERSDVPEDIETAIAHSSKEES